MPDGLRRATTPFRVFHIGITWVTEGHPRRARLPFVLSAVT